MRHSVTVIQSTSCSDARRNGRLLLRSDPEFGVTSELFRVTPKNASIETPMSFRRTESKEIGDSRGHFAMLCFRREAPEWGVAFSDLGE